MNRGTLVDVSDAGMDTQVSEVLRRPSRLRTLAELGVNAQSSAEALDRIARVACRVLSVPVALVNLIGADRQQFVGCGGPEPWASMRGMPLDAGFCPFVLAGDAYTLEDARKVPAHADDPAVELGVVAYAGVPLRAADGEPIGTLCAVDFEPRAWSEDDIALMADLAAGVIAELQLLTATRMIARDHVRLRSLAELSSALAPAESVADVLDEVSRSVDRLDTQGVWLLARRRLGGDPARGRAAAPAGGLRPPPDVPLAGPDLPATSSGRGSPSSSPPTREVRTASRPAVRGLGGRRAAHRGRGAAGGARRLLRRRASARRHRPRVPRPRSAGSRGWRWPACPAAALRRSGSRRGPAPHPHRRCALTAGGG